jgi:hypothetical protein
LPKSTEATKAYSRAHYHKNREKRMAQQNAWRAANPERARTYNREARLKSSYGLTPERFEALLSSQGSCCAICETDTPGGRGTWKVDHCHTSGKVRGLLCNGCNVGLGYFKDDTNALKRATSYLEMSNANAS